MSHLIKLQEKAKKLGISLSQPLISNFTQHHVADQLYDSLNQRVLQVSTAQDGRGFKSSDTESHESNNEEDSSTIDKFASTPPIDLPTLTYKQRLREFEELADVQIPTVMARIQVSKSL